MVCVRVSAAALPPSKIDSEADSVALCTASIDISPSGKASAVVPNAATVKSKLIAGSKFSMAMVGFEDTGNEDLSTVAPSSAAESFAEHSSEACSGVRCCCSRCQGRWQAWKDAVRLAERQVPGDYEAKHSEENHFSAQIRLDTRRTFPELTAFGEKEEEHLFRLLNAYANHNPEVGYCQGMNFVAGLLILVSDCDDDSDAEEDVFGVFVCLMDNYGLAGFYEESFSLLLTYVSACDTLLAEVAPALKMHLDEQGLQYFLYLHEWLLTLFINCLPFPAVLAIWDVVMHEGLHVLVSATVSILQALEETILSCRFEQIYRLCKSLRACEAVDHIDIGSSVQDFKFQWLLDRACYTDVPQHILRNLRSEAAPDELPPRAGFRASIKRVLRSLSFRDRRRGCETQDPASELTAPLRSLSLIAPASTRAFEPRFTSMIEEAKVAEDCTIAHEAPIGPTILCEKQRICLKGRLSASPAWTTVHGCVVDRPSEDDGFVIKRSASTDADGWQYASAFKAIPYSRRERRAKLRWSALVRQRYWVVAGGIHSGCPCATPEWCCLSNH